jgi:DNA-binding transcriptional LysR family regulator
MLNPNWLKTFVTLIDIGHFTKTAEKLYMTQPGVSQHLSKLEKACGHALIHRYKKSFDITEQGFLVYQYAKQLVKNEYELLEQLDFDNPFSGDCKLACSGALALTLYPKLLSIQVQHSLLVVQLKAAPNHQILNEIQNSIIDLGIVTDIPNNSPFDVQEIGREQLCLVLPANTETEDFDGNLLTKLGLVDHPDAKHYLSLYFAQNLESNFTQLNIEQLPVTGYVNQISQILEPVAKGLGFTVLPKSAVDSFKEPRLLKIFKPQKPVIEILYMVKKRNRVLPARFEVVKSILQNHFDVGLKAYL